MFNKKTIIILFFVMALVQLYVPAKMIIDYETIISSGEPFKFKIAPVDPLDPFRGKYITLDFKDVTATVPDPNVWRNDETIYVQLTTDNSGYAMIRSVSKTKPLNNDFVEAKVGFIGSTNDKKLIVKYPFDRFYMEETKASGAEMIYREAARDPKQVAYALVYIREGEAALTDVFINDISIQKIVEDYNENQE
jgi:uncharacterized membrane-anchored protein